MNIPKAAERQVAELQERADAFLDEVATELSDGGDEFAAAFEIGRARYRHRENLQPVPSTRQGYLVLSARGYRFDDGFCLVEEF